ncbi:MAG: response regulator [Planctomycetes bacterium]|nr:response regulator [Planctomycetota bacterium]
MPERVVIVDDEEGILALLRRVLRAPDREIEVFPSPLPALPAIRQRRPDLVISDLHMPGMPGQEFVRTLRGEFGGGLGIILITAFPALIADADAVADGVGAWLRKPFTDLELLRTTVAEVIEAGRRGGADEVPLERRLAAARAARLRHRANLSRADAMMQSIGDAVLLLDPDGRIHQLNPPAAALFGQKVEECLGRDLSCLPIEPALLQALLDAVATGAATSSRRRVTLARGARVVDVSGVPLVAAGGGAAGAFAVVRDVTAEVRVQELKHHYLGAIAHELRTPLTALQSFAACLARKPVEDGRRDLLLEAMQGQLTRLERQIDKLLLLAEFDRGEAADPAARPAAPFRVAGPVGEAVALCRAGAREKGVTLAAPAIDDALEALGHPDDLRRAVVELAENAVKFTPPGGRIDVVAAAGAGQVEVRVRDTGIGIAGEHHDAIFAGFRQLEDPLTRVHAGAGLGLSLAARMVAVNGGRITVDSAPGSGSTFTVRLPAAPVAVVS